MAQHRGFAVAREWIIGIALAVIVPLTTYYSVEVFLTYIKDMPSMVTMDSSTQTARERAWKTYENRELERNRILFYVALLVGIASIIIGNFILNAHLSLTIGLTLGGIFTLVMGYTIYWTQFTLILKFLSLVAAGILLFFVALHRLKR